MLAAARVLDAEPVAVGDALGRVMADELVADITLPPFDSSAMDGFALVAGPAAELVLVGESQAGVPFDGVVQPGHAVRISTGAVMPDGANAVVPIERACVGEGSVSVGDSAPGDNLRRAGEDVRAGDLVMRAGAELGPPELGMLAALGRVDASCTRRPLVTLAATGDELREPGEPLAPGQIYDSNATAIGALAIRAGARIASRTRIRDDAAATVADLERIATDADIVCITGGVSVGPHDHVRPALQQIGFEEDFWRVSLKPGKPFWFGTRDRDGRRQYAFGLPGNPVSAMVTFTLFARPLLRALQGADPSATRTSAILDGPIAANPDRDQAVRCSLELGEDGWRAQPTGAQGSHVISSMIGANALAIVPAGERDLGPGERVLIELL